MENKGQVTIFIIIGIFALTAIAIFFGFRSELITEEIEKTEVAPLLSGSLQSYVESCIQEKGKEAIQFVSAHGGYYLLPEISHQNLALPYYLYQNQSYVISQRELERQLSLYIDNELFFCIRNFAPFQKTGLKIEQGEIATTAMLNSNRVVFDVTFPITVEQDTLAKTLLHFSGSIDSRIGTIHDIVTEFMQLQEKNSRSYCVSCLVNLLIEPTLRVEKTFVEDGIMLFTIIDDDEMLEYSFLNQYLFE